MENERLTQALEYAAKADPRFRVVLNPHELHSDCYTYINLETGKPELFPMGSTAEEAFALAYNLEPIFID